MLPSVFGLERKFASYAFYMIFKNMFSLVLGEDGLYFLWDPSFNNLLVRPREFIFQGFNMFRGANNFFFPVFSVNFLTQSSLQDSFRFGRRH